jgi:hypothetical protein
MSYPQVHLYQRISSTKRPPAHHCRAASPATEQPGQQPRARPRRFSSVQCHPQPLRTERPVHSVQHASGVVERQQGEPCTSSC